jgi:formate hydrogenlyase subunit 3/multisubunit Na+/H+ antiporter MnhD subunit
MLLGVWAALLVVFLAGDFFTLYVGLELVAFAAVPLVSLDGRAETLQAALRYLLYALAGSVLYLVGTVLIYGGYGMLDIALLSQRARADAVTIVALALMTAGLLAKTALFPLHLWLPPAHAGAPAAASALLSGLVIKGSFFLVIRLWLDAFAGVVTPEAAQLLAALGAGAIIVGSVVALQQARLKLMVAFSTVAQIGYLFLMFPLVLGAVSAAGAASALAGGLLQAISHATAKAAMFMAAGLVYAALGHDRVADLRGVARALPLTIAAFALSGIALIGLPPAGGFLAKWLLLSAALESAQWWWVVVIALGGLLTAAYVFLVLSKALTTTDEPVAITPVPRASEVIVLALAIVSALLGVAALAPLDLVLIGRDELMSGAR